MTKTNLFYMVLVYIGRTQPFQCGSSSYASAPYNAYSSYGRSSSHYSCDDGYCVGRYYVCDGTLDCLNGRDEINCGECHRMVGAYKGAGYSLANSYKYKV